jgi:hypothetical protein
MHRCFALITIISFFIFIIAAKITTIYIIYIITLVIGIIIIKHSFECNDDNPSSSPSQATIITSGINILREFLKVTFIYNFNTTVTTLSLESSNTTCNPYTVSQHIRAKRNLPRRLTHSHHGCLQKS